MTLQIDFSKYTNGTPRRRWRTRTRERAAEMPHEKMTKKMPKRGLMRKCQPPARQHFPAASKEAGARTPQCQAKETGKMLWRRTRYYHREPTEVCKYLLREAQRLYVRDELDNLPRCQEAGTKTSKISPNESEKCGFNKSIDFNKYTICNIMVILLCQVIHLQEDYFHPVNFQLWCTVYWIIDKSIMNGFVLTLDCFFLYDCRAWW